MTKNIVPFPTRAEREEDESAWRISVEALDLLDDADPHLTLREAMAKHGVKRIPVTPQQEQKK